MMRTILYSDTLDLDWTMLSIKMGQDTTHASDKI
jgi:hypothetical protein